MKFDRTQFALDPQNTDSKRIKLEREKARALKKSRWWIDRTKEFKCHHCGKKVKSRSELTMDHLTPLARGGVTSKQNCVPSCFDCNQKKHLETNVDKAFQELELEKRKRARS